MHFKNPKHYLKDSVYLCRELSLTLQAYDPQRRYNNAADDSDLDVVQQSRTIECASTCVSSTADVEVGGQVHGQLDQMRIWRKPSATTVVDQMTQD